MKLQYYPALTGVPSWFSAGRFGWWDQFLPWCTWLLPHSRKISAPVSNNNHLIPLCLCFDIKITDFFGHLRWNKIWAHYYLINVMLILELIWTKSSNFIVLESWLWPFLFQLSSFLLQTAPCVPVIPSLARSVQQLVMIFCCSLLQKWCVQIKKSESKHENSIYQK